MAIESAESKPAASGEAADYIFRTIRVSKIASQDTKTGKTFYKITDDNDKMYQTWSSSLAQKVSDLQDEGKEVFIACTKQKSGKYTNWVLEAIEKDARELQQQAGKNGSSGKGDFRSRVEIIRCEAVAAAATVFSGTGVVVEEILTLAARFEEYIIGEVEEAPKSGALPDDDNNEAVGEEFPELAGK